MLIIGGKRAYRPGDKQVCCIVCRHVFGTWPHESGDFPIPARSMTIYCPDRRCKTERQVIVLDPPADRIAA